MKIKEKFRDEIFDIACKGDSVAVDKNTNEIVSCGEICCAECKFNSGAQHCSKLCEQYLNEEYKNPAAVKQYSVDILTKDGKLSEGDVESALLAAGFKVVGIQFRDDITDDYKRDYKELLD
nr:MAG TPA: Mating pheromone En-2 nobilii pheromone, disulfide-rich protein [Caudoviricetes sp.]